MCVDIPCILLADGETKDEDTHALVNHMGPEAMGTSSSHNPLVRVSHMTLPLCKGAGKCSLCLINLFPATIL